jgi:hypothetical protein
MATAELLAAVEKKVDEDDGAYDGANALKVTTEGGSMYSECEGNRDMDADPPSPNPSVEARFDD